MAPGSEPILLDLEKLFLLSDSMENLKLNGKIEIAEPERKLEKLISSYFDQDSGFLTFGASSSDEISCRIRICGRKPPNPSPRPSFLEPKFLKFRNKNPEKIRDGISY